jgi:hypothetical protein
VSQGRRGFFLKALRCSIAYQLPRSKLAWFVTALRLSSGGAGFGIITRYDWRVDDRPADIDRRDVVCRSGEPSDATEKVFMAIALYSPYKH